MSGDPFTAVLRFDASPEIGGGHAVRCLALADTLASHGWHCHLACRPETFNVVPMPTTSPHQVLELAGPESGEARELCARLPEGCRVLVVDHFGRDESFEQACRGWADRIMAIDGQLRPHACDLLLDPNPGRDGAAWNGLVPATCKILSGSDHALLRPGFGRHRTASLQRRESPLLERILIALGAGGCDELIEVCLQGIAAAGYEKEVVVLAGATRPPVRQEWPFGLSWHRWVEEPAALLAAADLLIGAGGATLWEACCLGLPALLVERAPNQSYPIARLASAGAAMALGPAAGLRPEDVADALRSLLRQPAGLREMSRRAATHCDGRGCERVVTALLSMAGSAEAVP